MKPMDIKEGDFVESQSGAKGIVSEVSIHGVWIDSEDWEPYSEYGVSIGVGFGSIINHNKKQK